MLDSHLRTVKDALLLPLARVCYNIHPTIISFLGLMVGLLAVAFLTQQQYGWGLLFWLLNRLLDGLDGAVARASGKQSDLGGYLDIMFDFVIYSLLPIAVVAAAPSLSGFAAVAFLLATFYVNAASWMYLAALLEKRRQGASQRSEQTSVTMPAGLIGGAETILFYCLFIIWPGQLVLLLTLMSVLVLLTIIQRLVWATQNLT